jgi:hypothetical protein
VYVLMSMSMLMLMLMLMSNVNVALFDQDDGFKRLPAAYLMIFLTYYFSQSILYSDGTKNKFGFGD